jgi:hypothetical protein
MNEADQSDRLRHYLQGTRPVELAEAIGTTRHVRPAGISRPTRSGVLGLLAVVFCAGVAAAIVVVVSASPPRGSLTPSPSGPCVGAPPGCGSAGSSAEALASGSWSSFPSGPLQARFGEVVVWTGRELIVWGGAARAGGEPLSSGAAYDPATRRWRMLPASPLSAAYAAAVWTGSEMIVVGGDASGILADAAAYDPTSNRWRTLPSSPLGPLTNADALWTGQQVIVIGGRSRSDSVIASRSVAAYDPETNTWQLLPALPAMRNCDVYQVAALWTGGGLIAWEDCLGQRVTSDGFTLMVGATAWTSITPSPIGGALAAAWTGDSVLVFGSNTRCPPLTSCYTDGPFDTATYVPSTHQWTSLVPQPDGLWPPVWTGRALLIGGPVQMVAFDPASGRSLNLPDIPAALGGPDQGPLVYDWEAIWTGSELLVWGKSSVELRVPGDG